VEAALLLARMVLRARIVLVGHQEVVRQQTNLKRHRVMHPHPMLLAAAPEAVQVAQAALAQLGAALLLVRTRLQAHSVRVVPWQKASQ